MIAPLENIVYFLGLFSANLWYSNISYFLFCYAGFGQAYLRYYSDYNPTITRL